MEEKIEFKNVDEQESVEKREIAITKSVEVEEIVTIGQLEDEIRGHRATAKGHNDLADKKQEHLNKIKEALEI